MKEGEDVTANANIHTSRTLDQGFRRRSVQSSISRGTHDMQVNRDLLI